MMQAATEALVTFQYTAIHNVLVSSGPRHSYWRVRVGG
jgi:hypothetical protein